MVRPAAIKIMALQWSHDFSVMETWVDQFGVGPTDELQWSHDFSVMETYQQSFLSMMGV